ncbi:hypothetical protein [Labrenzia sp. PHM005]|uniref:hypothetical protein n=1 Tax=Labrenzia sp. PHM005 TaxID=2590016 RepID=UPI0011400CD7|nr:hypothetical protein [Labrenzia sp. PHM005]QDG74389.1 hypothetical protein FJ695_00040 [Labrenzia sp. PHM005]
MKMKLIIAVATISMSATSAFASCSSGFFTNAACEMGWIDRNAANLIDRGHGALGSPMDRFAQRIVDRILPGSNPGFGRNQHYNERYTEPRRMIGNYCATQYGRFGPVQPMPVGSFCADIYGNRGHIVR